MTSDARAVLERYLQALLAGDLVTLRQSFAADATWALHGTLPISGPWRGRDEIVDDFLVKAAGELFEPGSQRFEWLVTVAEGDTVVLEWRVVARTRTGRDYDNRYLAVFETADGHITAVREYTDTSYLARLLFASEPTS